MFRATLHSLHNADVCVGGFGDDNSMCDASTSKQRQYAPPAPGTVWVRHSVSRGTGRPCWPRDSSVLCPCAAHSSLCLQARLDRAVLTRNASMQEAAMVACRQLGFCVQTSPRPPSPTPADKQRCLTIALLGTLLHGSLGCHTCRDSCTSQMSQAVVPTMMSRSSGLTHRARTPGGFSLPPYGLSSRSVASRRLSEMTPSFTCHRLMAPSAPATHASTVSVDQQHVLSPHLEPGGRLQKSHTRGNCMC